ncbi:F-box/kelch-repeat protein At1g57790-like [Papaver somniferum]|uniref:F-box/kelch-repeat protein At1g57790-like n=1 Tax=Papaver somniferum TaxID=3469 RepID=UPI000E701973|nr:F-box/kelch-repeat protein At1g57790-like [Papaver somniferum]
MGEKEASSRTTPWLVFPYGKGKKKQALYNICEPNNTNCIKIIPELSRKAFWQKPCHKGWLVILCDDNGKDGDDDVDVNQSSNIPNWNYGDYISFTSLPTAPDCIVFGIDGRGFGITIYSIRRGEQEWEVVSFEDSHVEKYSPLRNTLTLFDGVFYSVGYDGTLNKLNLSDDTFEYLKKPLELFNDSFPSFLVKCGEDLLLVKLCPKMLVRIFRMDFSEMEWVKVESLRKHVLFISDITCFSAIAPNSRMENKVYFPRLYLEGEGILCYSLETGSYHSFGGTSQHSATNNIYGTKGWLSNCTWIQPNWSKSTAQELDWLNSLT